jgi:hypothetical protein
VETLGKLAYSADAVIAESAHWALSRIQPPRDELRETAPARG